MKLIAAAILGVLLVLALRRKPEPIAESASGSGWRDWAPGADFV